MGTVSFLNPLTSIGEPAHRPFAADRRPAPAQQAVAGRPLWSCLPPLLMCVAEPLPQNSGLLPVAQQPCPFPVRCWCAPAPSAPADRIVMLQRGISSLPLVFPVRQASPCWLESFPLQSVSKHDLPIRKLPRPEDVRPSIFSSQNGPSTSQQRMLKIFSLHIGKLFNFSQSYCQAARSEAWKTTGIKWRGEKTHP